MAARSPERDDRVRQLRDLVSTLGVSRVVCLPAQIADEQRDVGKARGDAAGDARAAHDAKVLEDTAPRLIRTGTMANMTDVSTEELQAFKAAFFRALAHPVRIRILEILVRGDRSVHELQETLGVDQPVVSQQLAVLRATNIVSGKKEGVRVRYMVRDPLVGKLLETARQIFNNHLVGTQDLLRELQREHRRR